MTNNETKEIQLPSLGVFYKGAIPDGNVFIRKWTVADLAMLANQSMSMTDKLRKLVDTCTILPGDMKHRDLLMTDRFAILLYQREFSLGTSKYKFDYRCKYCGKVVRNHICDVAEEFDIRNPPEGASEPIMVTLPDAGVEVGLRLLRGIDEAEVATTANRLAMQSNDPADPSTIVRMCRALVSFKGDENIKFTDKERIVRGLSARDSITMNNAMDAVESGIETKLHPSCRACGAENEVDMMEVLSAEFFRPTAL
jgi:hypothetical protein